jgi:hypothetical protein
MEKNEMKKGKKQAKERWKGERNKERWRETKMTGESKEGPLNEF